MNTCRFIQSFFLSYLFFITAGKIAAQSTLGNELKMAATAAVNAEERISAYQKLANYYYAFKQEEEGDDYIDRMILEAEQSRDENLQRIAFFENPAFLTEHIMTLEAAKRKEHYVERALQFAKRVHNSALIALAYNQYSFLQLNSGNLEQADYFAEIANTNALGSGNDTAIVSSFIQQGNVNKAMGKALIALQKYSNALDLSVKKGHEDLESEVYHAMAQFYKELGKINIGRELIFKSMDLNTRSKNRRGLMADYQALAVMCENRDVECQRTALQKAMVLADSLHELGVKIECKKLLFYTRFTSQTSDSMLHYFDGDTELTQYFTNAGPGNLDWVYGRIYLYHKGGGKIDSALFYLKKAEDALFTSLIMNRKKGFIAELAYAYEKKDIDKAIETYQNLLNLDEQTSDLNGMARNSLELKSLFEKKGDYQNAYRYNKLYDEYNKLLTEQARDNEVDLLTLDNDRKEKIRQEQELKDAQRRYYNLQYMIIGVLIITLFVGLAMMGMYRVSRKTIRMVGFFSFLLLFEFVTLISKKWMTQYTKGMPWQDLLFMIALAFVMLPLHHWLEHQIINFLTSRNLLKGHTPHDHAHSEKKPPPEPVKEGEVRLKKSLN